jgi:integrase
MAATSSDHLTFITTAAGAGFSAAGFVNAFREWCDGAGLPQRCSAHGLRKAGLTRHADAGATEHQLAAIGGFESLSQVRIYTKAANRRRLAGQAMAQLVGAMSDTKTGTGCGEPCQDDVANHS